MISKNARRANTGAALRTNIGATHRRSVPLLRDIHLRMHYTAGFSLHYLPARRTCKLAKELPSQRSQVFHTNAAPSVCCKHVHAADHDGRCASRIRQCAAAGPTSSNQRRVFCSSCPMSRCANHMRCQHDEYLCEHLKHWRSMSSFCWQTPDAQGWTRRQERRQVLCGIRDRVAFKGWRLHQHGGRRTACSGANRQAKERLPPLWPREDSGIT